MAAGAPDAEPESLRALQDHGVAEPRLEVGLPDALRLLDELHRAGVDYEDVVATLEREGIENFVASFSQLLQRVEARRLAAAAA